MSNKKALNARHLIVSWHSPARRPHTLVIHENAIFDTWIEISNANIGCTFLLWGVKKRYFRFRPNSADRAKELRTSWAQNNNFEFKTIVTEREFGTPINSLCTTGPIRVVRMVWLTTRFCLFLEKMKPSPWKPYCREHNLGNATIQGFSDNKTRSALCSWCIVV